MLTDIDIAASAATFDTYSGYTQTHKGIEIWKCRDDMARYRRIIEQTGPDVVVETGTKWGGFAAWLADEFGVTVITVDNARPASRPGRWPGVHFVEGDSVSLGTLEDVCQLVGMLHHALDHARVMVSLDSDHHRLHVEKEINTYGGLVSVGCHLVVEDGLADLSTGAVARRIGRLIPEQGGPLRAVEATLCGSERWGRDLEIENMSPISHSPGGWWVRRG